MAGARFLKHNIRDDFDDLTDVARLYGIRAVPCFVFFIGGAQVFIHPFITRLPIRRSGALQHTFYGSPPACPVLGFPAPM